LILVNYAGKKQIMRDHFASATRRKFLTRTGTLSLSAYLEYSFCAVQTFAQSSTPGSKPQNSITEQTKLATKPSLTNELKTYKIHDNLLLIALPEANILVSRNDDNQLLLVDGGPAAMGDVVLEACENFSSGSTINYLLNTHWHPEQTGLNVKLGEQGTTIMAHANTKQWLSTDVTRLGLDYWDTEINPALPVSGRPKEIFYHYGDLAHGNTSVKYGYLRQAHTDGDMYVYLPEANVLHTGGVISSDRWPLMDWWTGGWIGGVVNAIEIMLGMSNADTVIIPATGPVLNRSELLQMRDMYASIYQEVNRLFVSANTVKQTVAAKPAQAWENQFGPADDFIAQAHWSLIPHLTPDA
jgi:cyclase